MGVESDEAGGGLAGWRRFDEVVGVHVCRSDGKRSSRCDRSVEQNCFVLVSLRED